MTDEEIRATYRWIVAEPREPGADVGGPWPPEDTSLEYMLAGVLTGTIIRRSGEIIDKARALRIVREEHAAIRARQSAKPVGPP